MEGLVITPFLSAQTIPGINYIFLTASTTSSLYGMLKDNCYTDDTQAVVPFCVRLYSDASWAFLARVLA